ncbi:hypothetical protein [Paucisalibacillus sp. EB02]|uniref:hypothetical protein n=1 Tax=Paucisalibacillus sp. EB02 TaxID=1347087 RepID=UPI0004AF47C6|nr:hypothetical protein [Paucisalibacillus sp. EB02]
MELYLGESRICSIPEEAIPVFYYCFLELGYQIEMNRTDGRINLLPGLYNKSILLIKDQSLQNTLRREEFEDQLLRYIGKSLMSCGVHLADSEYNKPEQADLTLSVTASQIQYINQPILEIYYYKGDVDAEWIKNIKVECQKLNIKFNINKIDNTKDYQTVKVHVMYPEAMKETFWENIGENVAFILSIGLISKLQKSYHLTPLSIFPFEVYLKGLRQSDNRHIGELDKQTNLVEDEIENIDYETENEEKEIDQSNNIIDTSADESSSQREIAIRQENRLNAEAFFDYHILIDQSNSKSPKIFGNLTIKNTGLESLKNPIICFRMTPAGSVGIISQILQPNTIQTQGIQTADGPKGWRYMNENWQHEADEKGEIWVCPVHEIYTDPGDNIQLPNIQFTVKSLEEDKNIKVEAFIFYAEHGLEIPANNKISLLLNRG